jgi:hypothetical protein
MANAYFCNCVADKIGVNLNNQLAPGLLNTRAVGEDGKTNNLPMAIFPIAGKKERESGKFSTTATNTVVITFETLRLDTGTFEIAVEKSLVGHDLYFYVFENTLVGQDQAGRSAGISIQAHETIKKLIQSGAEISHS